MFHSAIKKSWFAASRPASALQKAPFRPFLARGFHENVIFHYKKPTSRSVVGSLPKHDIDVGTGHVGAPAGGDVDDKDPDSDIRPRCRPPGDEIKMSGEKFYIKGYKLDCEKIKKTFRRMPGLPDNTWDIDWYMPIIDHIPETAYSYVGVGLEPDDEYILVLVLDNGTNEAALKKTDVDVPESLPEGALQVLTPGVWESVD